MSAAAKTAVADPTRAILDRTIPFILVALTLVTCLWPVSQGVRVTQEDGFYYFRIAQNLAQGRGPTFDGIEPTNGFHPLWLLTLVPVFWVMPDSPSALVTGTILQALFLAGAAVLVYAAARLYFSPLPSSLGALLWIMLVYRVALGGTEFSLHALLLIATAYLYLRWSGEPRVRTRQSYPSVRLYFGLGVLTSLTLLSRLDTALLAGSLGLALGYRELRSGLARGGLGRLAAFGLPVALVAASYIGLNVFLFGVPLPISSLVKQAWSSQLLAADPLYQSGGWWLAKVNQMQWPLHGGLYPLYVALGSYGAAALWLGLRVVEKDEERYGRAAQALGPLVLYSLVSLASYSLLFHGGLVSPTWYYVIQPWLVCLIFAGAVEELRRFRVNGAGYLLSKRLAQIAAPVLVLLVLGNTARSLARWQSEDRVGTPVRALYDAAEWARANVPEHAVIGAWNAGTIGYLSGKRVVNLDGVANSYDFFRSEQRDLCRYWERQGITYLVDAFQNVEALASVPTFPSYAPCVARLERLWSDNRYGASWSLEAYHIRTP